MLQRLQQVCCRLAFPTHQNQPEIVHSIEINKIIPEMIISISHTLQGTIIPGGFPISPFLSISRQSENWIKNSSNLVYNFQWYGNTSNPRDAINNALAIQNAWNVPIMATEFTNCNFWKLAKENNISTTYWHYSSFCNTGPAFGNRKTVNDTFGACILGWGSGISSDYCDNN